jgi:hypothetical protein
MLTNKTRNLRLLAILGLVALAVAGGNALASRTTGGQAGHSGSRFISSGHARDLECSTCHQCELPTAEDPCLISCPRHHGHFDTDARADDGPDVVLIGELANLYDPVPFSHGLHAQMSDMIGGCENCHHYSEPGGRIPPCRECHDPDKTEVDLKMPSLKGAYHRQCMNCHLDWSHDKACSFCHKEHEEGMPIPDDPSDIVGVEHHPLIKATDSYFYETTYEKGPIVSFHHTDHVDQFGLDCVDCHSGDTCARCHDQQSKRTVPAGHITGSRGVLHLLPPGAGLRFLSRLRPETHVRSCRIDRLAPGRTPRRPGVLRLSRHTQGFPHAQGTSASIATMTGWTAVSTTVK